MVSLNGLKVSIDYSIKSMAEEDELEIADHYRGTHNKKYFLSWDKKDGNMIRYFG